MLRGFDKVIFALLALLVLLSPIPLGANRDWSWTLCALLTAGLSLTWLAGTLAARRPLFTGLPPAIPLLFLLAVAWAWLQMQPWLPAGWKHPVWELAGGVLGGTSGGTSFTGPPGAISLAPEDNGTAIMRLLSYGLVFFLAFQLARDRDLARRAFRWVFVAAVVYSLYGLLSYWGILRDLMWYQDDAFGRDVRATFVNRNHFANWLGIALVCAMAYFFDHMLHAPRYPMLALESRQRRFDRFLRRAWPPLAGLVLLVSALVSSHSRGGFIATFCGVLALMLLIDRKQRSFSAGLRAVAASALLISATAFFISAELLMERFDNTEVDAEGRAQIYRQVSEGIADNPLLGFGYGAFEDGFKLYRGEEILKRVDRAHNSYLENVFELGLPAALCLFGAVLGLALVCLHGLARRHRDWVYPAAGVAATVLAAVHALVDFGMQIPATAMLYAFVMGVACAQAFSSREPGDLKAT